MEASYHTVVKGDTLWQIGRDYGINWRYIQAWNKLPDPNKISIGQKILIPGGTAFQVIKDCLEAATYLTSHKIAGLITALQEIVNGSGLTESRKVLVEYGLEAAFYAIISRIHPYGAIAATVILLLRWGYKKYYSSGEK